MQCCASNKATGSKKAVKTDKAFVAFVLLELLFFLLFGLFVEYDEFTEVRKVMMMTCCSRFHACCTTSCSHTLYVQLILTHIRPHPHPPPPTHSPTAFPFLFFFYRPTSVLRLARSCASSTPCTRTSTS